MRRALLRGESGAYYNWCTYVADKYKDQEILKDESYDLPPRSVEYCAYIIEALETGKTFKFSGNLRNNGMISNLPDECCAEGAVFADRTGLHRTVIGDIPPQCAALNMTNINVQRLAVLAAKSGDPETVVQAIALDPLTSSVLTLKEIRDMVTEMLDAQRQWLPQFGNRSPRPTPIIPTPANLQRAEVPIDPALAVFSRFGELAK
ncbi:family 4 glycosyl hydrolase [Cohnella herbarum]|uniref:family 4 glycosyl hydrolase n=1 Tax=Cohnella herbarum TaxID=2728023 RepID=UPI001C2C9592|nr:hypothetical protein [Cohnella herbarum]